MMKFSACPCENKTYEIILCVCACVSLIFSSLFQTNFLAEFKKGAKVKKMKILHG